MLKPNFAFWDILMLLRCLNSKEIKLQSSITLICIIFDLFFQLKIKNKTNIPSSTTISTLCQASNMTWKAHLNLGFLPDFFFLFRHRGNDKHSLVQYSHHDNKKMAATKGNVSLYFNYDIYVVVNILLPYMQGSWVQILITETLHFLYFFEKSFDMK